MKEIIALLLSAIFLLLSGIHIYWGLGGRWGATAAIPVLADNTPVMAPGPAACFIVALGLLVCLVPVLSTAGMLYGTHHPLLSYATIVLAMLFLLRAIGDFRYVGFFKKIRTTRFGKLDSRYYSPLCLAISLMLLLLQLLK